MDRLEDIKKKSKLLRAVSQEVRDAPDPVPSLGYCEWLVKEVDRLRKIEDSAISWNNSPTIEETRKRSSRLSRTLEFNPRPGRDSDV